MVVILNLSMKNIPKPSKIITQSVNLKLLYKDAVSTLHTQVSNKAYVFRHNNNNNTLSYCHNNNPVFKCN